MMLRKLRSTPNARPQLLENVVESLRQLVRIVVDRNGTSLIDDLACLCNRRISGQPTPIAHQRLGRREALASRTGRRQDGIEQHANDACLKIQRLVEARKPTLEKWRRLTG